MPVNIKCNQDLNDLYAWDRADLLLHVSFQDSLFEVLDQRVLPLTMAAAHVAEVLVSVATYVGCHEEGYASYGDA